MPHQLEHRKALPILLAVAALVFLAFGTGNAWATDSHHYAGTLDTGTDPVFPFGPCAVRDLDVDAQGNIYVLCGGDGLGGAVVKKFDPAGNPVNFTGHEPYLQANALIGYGDPNAGQSESYESEYGQSLYTQSNIAVGTSGPAAGYMFITEAYRLAVYKPTGEFIGAVKASGNFGIGGFTTGPEGDLYYSSGFKIDKRDISLAVVAQLYASEKNSFADPAHTDMAIDSNGGLWGIGEATEASPYNSVERYEADQFGAPELESEYSLGHHKAASTTPLTGGPLKQFGVNGYLEGGSLGIDRSDNSLFVERAGYNENTILQFSSGTEEETSHQIAAPIGNGSNVGLAGAIGVSGTVKGIAYGPEGTIYAANGSHAVSRFVAGGPLPTVRDPQPEIDALGHTEGTVSAELEVPGGGPISECKVVYGTERSYGQSIPCDGSAPYASGSSVSAHITGLETGVEYHYAFVASNAEGTGYGIDRTFSPVAVLHLHTTGATDITDRSATFTASLDPDGMSTTYHFEYGLTGALTAETGESAPIGGTGSQQISVPVANLATGKKYEYRVVATNSLGTTLGQIQTMQVAGPPTISGAHATNVRSEEADLEAQVGTLGYPTTYSFEYGLTTEYGSVAPAEPASAGEAAGSTDVSQHLAGLEPGRVYHFRLVATNKWGTTVSDDTTFNFLPENCPNERVRQQMKSSYLPDCRAYELVTPGNVEGAQIYPGSEALLQGSEGLPENNLAAVGREIQNTGLANDPSRFSYYVGLGAIASLDAPNAALDQYIATRTNSGWVSSFSGLRGTEAALTAQKVCSITLDECLDHNLENPFSQTNEEEGERPRASGFLFNVVGEPLGPAPTNWQSVANGKRFHGMVRASGDFSHLAVASRDAVFAPGGQTAVPGSVYDNDLKTGSLTVISVLRDNKTPIPGYEEGPFQFITIPPTGISTDGSHILMETQAPEEGGNTELRRLYLRVNDERTYEIGEGPVEGEPAPMKFIGMTSDGSKILFLTYRQLVAEDKDESADIYLWNENGGNPTLTLVSKGEGPSAGDACKASWTEKCSVALLVTKETDRTGFDDRPEPGRYGELEYQNVVFGGIDSKLSSSSAGVFFFSPESLTGPAPQNGKNLYEANEGSVHYVATLAPKETIDRIQISPDGQHVGLLTRAKLTSYENAGFEEMYGYTPSTGVLKCVSCLPTGEPPTADVEASQNGPFMSNDGRLFFSTSDPLVPGDADPYGIPDVYEYTQGRAQLISSGTSENGRAPGGAASFTTATLGLESVSADGRDVFFSTTDTLVPQDSNGHFAKIYDARTDGGFPVAEEPAPCVAADECHGTGSSTPPPLRTSTGTGTVGGNVPATKPHKKKHKKKHHKKKHHGKAKKGKADKRRAKKKAHENGGGAR